MAPTRCAPVDATVARCLLSCGAAEQRGGAARRFQLLPGRRAELVRADLQLHSAELPVTEISPNAEFTPKAVEKHIANIFGKLGLHADVSEDHRRVLAVLTYLRSQHGE